MTNLEREDGTMLNGRALWIATAVGTVLQVGMVVAGHYSPAVTRLFAVGGMGFSLVAGLVYGLTVRRGSTGALAVGGLVAGAVCAFLGILVSRLLGDVPTSLLALGTLSSAVTGAIGGAIARVFRRRDSAFATGAAAALVLASAALGGVHAQGAASVHAPPAAAAHPSATTVDSPGSPAAGRAPWRRTRKGDVSPPVRVRFIGLAFFDGQHRGNASKLDRTDGAHGRCNSSARALWEIHPIYLVTKPWRRGTPPLTRTRASRTAPRSTRTAPR